ncbi:SDR family NAD(P)-dependent oxidoreductase [Novosphingobium aquimarinum]|uniref:SDR family NAD(P)-dependent oxidoreductase n=1 Tax=Novosphingobium aquimarinum TaxID=2682494 RepID=UPI0012EB17B7|nr:SDR family NAD(P)-dependent oxidoreductase [Novosphingobium aquimarinum]
MERFKGKIATVTGGASGIGEAVARQLVAEGAMVVLADINEAGLEALARELGRACLPVRTDVSSEADVQAMVEAAVSHFGGLDIAFNVAGSARMSALIDQSEADFRFALDLCTVGTFFCIKHQARRMIEANVQGAIVNISSLNGKVPSWGLAAYSAAKAGVDMLTASGSLELADHGIRVNAVAPGMTATPATTYMTDEILGAYLERIPLKRPATARDQAMASLFLASDDAAYITGVCLNVDGGWQHAAYPDMRRWFATTPDSLS